MENLNLFSQDAGMETSKLVLNRSCYLTWLSWWESLRK